MNNNNKGIAILIVLLIATSFLVGNLFAGYKAKKLAIDFKDQAENKINGLNEDYNHLLWEQKVELIKTLLDDNYNNMSSSQLENLLSDDGIYVIRLNLAAQDTKDDVDFVYQAWLNNMENNLNNGRKSIIIHSGYY